MKAAYKGGGYTVMPVVTPAAYGGGRGINEIVINGATWAVRCETCYLPKAAAVQIVEDAGYLPVEAMTICKGEPNQMVMENVAAGRHGTRSTTRPACGTSIPGRCAALCELEKKELAPRCICQKCGERFHGEAVLCARCAIEARDRELNRQGNARRYWREMGPRKESGRETLKHER